MFNKFRDKIAASGFTVLIIGIALLIFTFVSAYQFLNQNLSILASEDLLQTFGEAFAPLIVTCIRIMYLGIMGWIGSLLTIRGVTIMTNLPKTPTAQLPKQAVTKQKLSVKKTKSRKMKSQPEPEFIVIPPEEVTKSTKNKNKKLRKSHQT
jgi:hypothetical protein